MEKNLPITPRHQALIQLRKSRNVEVALENYLNGTIDLDDLTEEEQGIYERRVRLMSMIKEKKGERFDRDDIIERHMKFWSISIATANRDLKFVNDQRKKLLDAEIEFHRAYLLEKAYDAIEEAEKDEIAGMRANGMSKNILAAARILGIDRANKDGEGSIDNTKIEQHVNIKVADERTNIILTEIVQNNISVLKHSTPIQEILRLEEEAKLKAQKIPPTDYETIGDNSTEKGD